MAQIPNSEDVITSGQTDGDNNLLNLVKDGNRVAFNELFDQYWEQLYSYAFKIIGSEPAAEDVTQEVFLDLWEKGRDRKIENLKAYLYHSVRYSALKQVRSKHYKDIHLETINQVLSDTAACSTTEELIEFNELNSALDNLIQELPHRCKEIFCMSRFEGLSNQEIAEKLSLSKRTVELQISNALRHLKLSKNKIASLLLSLFSSLIIS